MMERLRKEGKLRAGLYLSDPCAMKDAKGGYFGMDVDVAVRLAEDTGLALEIVPEEDWSNFIPGMLSGRFDVGIANMKWSAKRNMKVNFTEPYFWAPITALVSREAFPDVPNPQMLDRHEVRVALLRNCEANPVAKRSLPSADFRPYDTIPEMVESLLSNECHALVISEPVPSLHARRNPDRLHVPDFSFQKRDARMVTPPGDTDVLNLLNNWISTRTREGWLEERRRHWFDTDDWETHA